jgi:hypothetical protein
MLISAVGIRRRDSRHQAGMLELHEILKTGRRVILELAVDLWEVWNENGG